MCKTLNSRVETQHRVWLFLMVLMKGTSWGQNWRSNKVTRIRDRKSTETGLRKWGKLVHLDTFLAWIIHFTTSLCQGYEWTNTPVSRIIQPYLNAHQCFTRFTVSFLNFFLTVAISYFQLLFTSCVFIYFYKFIYLHA